MRDEHGEIHSADHDIPLGRVVLSCLAVLSVAAAVIHFAAAADYFQGYWLFSLSMLVAAWLQAAWAAVALIRPSRGLLQAGAWLNGLVLALYLITQTTGNGIGTAPHAAGLSGFAAGLSAALEAVLVAGCCWLLTARSGQRVRRQRLITAPAVTGGMTAALLGVALATAAPGGVTSTAGASTAGASTAGASTAGSSTAGSSAGGSSTGGSSTGGSSTGGSMPGIRMPGQAAAAIKLANSTPAGDITMPSPDMQMMEGMRMASPKPCVATPSAAQQQAAVRFVDSSWQGARKYRSLAAAKAAGYHAITPRGEPVVHYLNPAYYRATMRGGPVLDAGQPQSLVYANTPHGAVLVAAMYITTPGGPTPQPGGCLTQWHVHTNLCLTPGLGVVGAVGPGQPGCPADSVNRVTPAMIHVWFVPLPGGPTAIDAPDQQVVQAAERVAAPRNGTA
jgi:hypothetical protein